MSIYSFHLRIGEAAHFLGVSTKTLRRWDEAGRFKPSYRTEGNHRRYSLDLLKNRLKNFKKENSSGNDRPLRGAIYARVSAPKQKADLQRQIEVLKTACHRRGIATTRIYQDVASGINENRSGLMKMLGELPKRRFDVVYVSYKDRLSRFGSRIIKQYLKSWVVDLHVMHSTISDSTPHSELITDLTAILYSFMGRLYRSRRESKKTA